jgi:hypothetical protein
MSGEGFTNWAEIWKELSVAEIKCLRSYFDKTPSGALTLEEVYVTPARAVAAAVV